MSSWSLAETSGAFCGCFGVGAGGAYVAWVVRVFFIWGQRGKGLREREREKERERERPVASRKQASKGSFERRFYGAKKKETRERERPGVHSPLFVTRSRRRTMLSNAAHARKRDG